MEIAELEKSYQDQRKRLLGEIHGERLRQERENEVALIEKQRALEQKFEKLVMELQEKINKKEQEFQVMYVYCIIWCVEKCQNYGPKTSSRYCFQFFQKIKF